MKEKGMKKRIMCLMALVALLVFMDNPLAMGEMNALLEKYGIQQLITEESAQRIDSQEPIDPQGVEFTTNTFYGKNAGYYFQGEYNSFFGAAAGWFNDYGESNTFIGYGAGSLADGGEDNTCLGVLAGASNNTGKSNVFLGTASGGNNTTGSKNVFIGYKAGRDEKGSNKLYIDNSETSTPLMYVHSTDRSLQVKGWLLEKVASAWGIAPFVLGQDLGNRGIVITNKASKNQKNIYFGSVISG